MTKRRKILLSIFFMLVTVCFVFTLFLNIQKKRTQMIRNLSTEEKIQDFEALCNILDESYLFWNEARQAGVDRVALYEEYRENIENTDTDIEYFKEVQYFIKEFEGLGHLEVLDGQTYQLYMNTLAESEGMLSEAELQAIAPMKSVLADANVKKTYDMLDKSHSGFRSIVGLKEEYLGAEPAMKESQTAGLEARLLAGGTVAYIKIPDFQLVNYEADKIELTEFWKDAAETSNLIIDIRGNSGGSDKYWEELLVKPNAKETLVSLPNSGLIVRFSIFYGLNADGTGNEAMGTTPDILVSEDEDALEKCLSLF